MDDKNECIEEKFLNNQIQSIEIDKLMLFIEFSEKRICKIESKDGVPRTGFFCNFQKIYEKTYSRVPLIQGLFIQIKNMIFQL